MYVIQSRLKGFDLTICQEQKLKLRSRLYIIICAFSVVLHSAYIKLE